MSEKQEKQFQEWLLEDFNKFKRFDFPGKRSATGQDYADALGLKYQTLKHWMLRGGTPNEINLLQIVVNRSTVEPLQIFDAMEIVGGNPALAHLLSLVKYIPDSELEQIIKNHSVSLVSLV